MSDSFAVKTNLAAGVLNESQTPTYTNASTLESLKLLNSIMKGDFDDKLKQLVEDELRYINPALDLLSRPEIRSQGIAGLSGLESLTKVVKQRYVNKQFDELVDKSIAGIKPVVEYKSNLVNLNP